MTLTALLVRTYRNNLRMLLGVLDKAKAQRGVQRREHG